MMNNGQDAAHNAEGGILCGGRARRLGGVDKGLHRVAGRPLVEYVIERLRPQVTDMVISANRNPQTYAAFGYRVVADASGNFDGPLAGVLAALSICRSPWLVTAPCDAPRVPVDLASMLLDAAARAGTPTACAFDGERLQPAFCAYRRELADDLRAYLDAGMRKIDRFLDEVGVATVDFSNRADEFINLNSPEDVSRFEADHTDVL